MLKLGELQKLVVVKKVDFGVYLAVSKEEMDERVLLPVKQVPQECEIGTEIEVFLYKDSKDRLIATTNRPRLMMGEVALLKVAAAGKIGAFLDWGLEKDLFLPFKEQTYRVSVGDEVLVTLYIDKSSRLCAKMNVYDYLKNESPYHKDDRVTGRIYQTSDKFGAFGAVEDIYSALIPKKECFGNLRTGDVVSARVTKVNEDARLELAVREKAYIQMDADGERLMEMLKDCGGEFAFNDKASPERIRNEVGMSKNEFKRAVGHLLKAGKIEIGEKNIRLK